MAHVRQPTVTSCHYQRITSFSYVGRRNYILLYWQRCNCRSSAFWFKQIRNVKHDAVCHQRSLDKSSQDVSGVVLVIRHSGQARVEGHHDEGKLGQWAKQAGSVPSEAGLQVKHQIKHGVQRE